MGTVGSLGGCSGFTTCVTEKFLEGDKMGECHLLGVSRVDSRRIIGTYRLCYRRGNLLRRCSIFLRRRRTLRAKGRCLNGIVSIAISEPLNSRRPRRGRLICPIGCKCFSRICTISNRPRSICVLNVCRPVSIFGNEIVTIVHEFSSIRGG